MINQWLLKKIIEERGGFSADALLMDWIQTKVSEYQEPQRKGTPKGEPIGFSRAKYHAALLGLTNMRGNEIAMTAGASPGLVRKWRTELPFLNLISESIDEFEKYIWEKIKQKAHK